SSVIRALIVPRGYSSLIAKLVADGVRRVFLAIANRFSTYEAKDKILTLQAPLFVIVQLFTWLALFLFGYALMLWTLIDGHFGLAVVESGSSLFTLGFAGTQSTGAVVVHFCAAATGLGVVALQIGYLPTLYAAFNRRETLITTLQSRAGAPAWGPEILARHQAVNIVGSLPALYSEWESWAADVSESHTNYPVLLWLRSPHPLRSWILALLAVMDSAALCLAVSPSVAPNQARLCLRMGFVCLRNIADLLGIAYDPDPLPDDPIELTYEEFVGGVRRMEEVAYPMERTSEEAWVHFRGWRVNYERVAYRLADLVVAPPGPWSGERSHLPGMAIVPQRPADRQPHDLKTDARPKGRGAGL
ncbi:MAG: hypothetical protein ACRDJ5_08340, partial [Actinomycetota bacterium]